MKSNYKRLGDIITPVSVKNTDMLTSDLRGVNYQKFFMKSVANIIGVDLSGYKLVKKGQFACNLMHVGRDECLPIALHREEEPIIVSPAYLSFEVKNESEILSEFLFLWFKRKEFDREACFYTDADVRQGLIKSSFYDIKVPVPPIEVQRAIVAEYQAVERRIENNRRLIATLEATAQTIYRHMFVDDIDPANLPHGWRMGSVIELSDLRVGGDKPSIISDIKSEKCPIPIFSNGIENDGLYGFTNKASIEANTFTISARGTIGKCFLRFSPYYSIVRLISVIPHNPDTLFYQYHFFTNHQIEGDGSVQNQLTAPFLSGEKMLLPPIEKMTKFATLAAPLYRGTERLKSESSLLVKLQELLHSKLSKH